MSLLRTELRDAAVSAAKASAHAEVEPRHVIFAVARRFREHPELGSFFQSARQALEPRGNAFETPSLTEEAEALLGSIGSEEDAAALLTGTLETSDGGLPAAAPDGPAMEALEGEAAVATAGASPSERPQESPDEILAELDALVGLEVVKRQVRQVIAVVQANLERTKAGLKPVNPNLHLVFTGPPGTGKTTVARIVARLYGATGALPGSHFTEAGRSDLIAGYVGQTAIKTREIIERTRPGVLFIDEAYALTPRADADYGREAIATLVKAMEDHRDELAVIVAGYEDEMAEFVESNPGLRSRFKTYIDFPDYSAAELAEIFERLARDAGIHLGEGAREKAALVFRQAGGKKDFGNARFARSLFEQAYARMASRAAADGLVTIEELTTLLPEDIEIDSEDLGRERRRIGLE